MKVMTVLVLMLLVSLAGHAQPLPNSQQESQPDDLTLRAAKAQVSDSTSTTIKAAKQKTDGEGPSDVGPPASGAWKQK